MWFHIILNSGSKQVRVNEKGLMPEMLVVILQGYFDSYQQPYTTFSCLTSLQCSTSVSLETKPFKDWYNSTLKCATS